VLNVTPLPLCLPERTPEPTKQGAVLAPEQVWTFLEKRKIFCLWRDLKPDGSPRSTVTILTELLRLPCKWEDSIVLKEIYYEFVRTGSIWLRMYRSDGIVSKTKLRFLEKPKKFSHQSISICCRLLWRTACFHRVIIFYSKISAIECVVKNTAESFRVVICVSPSLNCVHAWEANERSISHLPGSFLFSNAIRSYIQLLTREHVGGTEYVHWYDAFVLRSPLLHTNNCNHRRCCPTYITTWQSSQHTLFRCFSVPVSWTSNGFSSLYSDQI
jgi:hypothetical protein